MQSIARDFASGATIDMPKLTTHNDCCTYCRKYPDGSMKFKRCSGCKIVNYCSTQCSKADWRSHKPSCRALQKNAQFHNDQGRTNMKTLYSWLDFHEHSLCQAAYAAMCNSRPDDRADGFDCSGHYLWLRLIYRPDFVGDTSRFYHLQAAELRRLEEPWLNGSIKTPAFDFSDIEHDFDPELRTLVAQTNAKLELQATFLASLPEERARCLAELPPEKVPCFIGLLPCRFEVSGPGGVEQMIQDYLVIVHDEYFLEPLRDENPPCFPPPGHDMWFARLQRRIDLGLCFGRDKHILCDIRRGLGRMVQVGPGGKWKWTPLEGEEAVLETQGYHHLVSGLVY